MHTWGKTALAYIFNRSVATKRKEKKKKKEKQEKEARKAKKKKKKTEDEYEVTPPRFFARVRRVPWAAPTSAEYFCAERVAL